MKDFVIQEIKSNNYIVLSTSYISPLDEIDTLQEELRHLNFSGDIVLDLLLCNGISDNRYVMAYFDGESLDFSTLNVISKVDTLISEKSKSFYMKNKELLTRGILPNAHKYIIEKGLI